MVDMRCDVDGRGQVAIPASSATCDPACRGPFIRSAAPFINLLALKKNECASNWQSDLAGSKFHFSVLFVILVSHFCM